MKAAQLAPKYLQAKVAQVRPKPVAHFAPIYLAQVRAFYPAEQVESVNTALATLETALATKVSNLSGDERRKYGSISEQNKLFVNKVNDYAMNQTALRSPDVDWDEFAKDFNSRTVLEGTISRLQNLLTGINNAKTLHDYDNYQAALDDYAYTNYKTGTSAPGYEAKRNELKQFFSRIKKVDEKETADKK